MGYYVRRRDGTNQFFEDDVPVAQAVAQVRRQDGYETNDGLLGDLGDALSGAGVAGITGALGQAMDFFGGPLTVGRRIAGQDTPGTGIAEMGRQHQARELETLSPEMARDISQEGWDQLNPGNVAFQGVASIPFLVGGMGPGLAARAAGAGPRASGAIAAVSEGGLSAGAVADQIEQEIAQIAAFEPETFLNSPLGREAMAEANGDYERAVEIAQVRGKGVAPLAAGAITAAISRVGINPFASQAGGLARRVLMGAGREGFEEFLQSGQEQAAVNIDVGNVDPERSVLEDVPESAVMGAITAAPMGGALGVLNGQEPSPGVTPPNPNVQLGGPAMPPPGGPGARPKGGLGNGNPPGWVPPDTANAEDAEFRELGEGQIEDQRANRPPRPEPQAQAQPQPEAAAEEAAQQYAQQYAAQGEVREYNEDEDAEWAGELETNFRQNGMASDTFPDKTDVVERVAEPVPMWRPGRQAIEDSDEEAHAIYSAAVANDLDVKDTAVFGLYSRMDNSMFVDERGDGSQPDGYGIKIIDKLKDGSERVSYVYTGADTMQQAELDAAPYRPKKAAEQAAEPIGEGSSLTEPQEETPAVSETEAAVNQETPEEAVRQTGQEVVATDKIRNLKPAANEALNAYRQKGEVGLQEYLAGLNITAAKSLLRNLGGQSVRTDKLNEVQGKIVRQVRNLATSADKRGLPTPQEEIVTPEVNTNVTDVSEQLDVKIEPTQEDYKEMARQRIKDAQAKAAERTTRSVMGETDAFAVKRPSRVAQEATEAAPVQERPIVDLPKREARSPAQIKEALRDAAALDDDAYDDAVSKLKITPEEAAAVREAMKTDKGLDNLRPTFNDALRAGKAKQSKQTTEAPKKEDKPATPQKERAEVNAEKARKEQDTADRNLARDMARSMPKNYDLVRRTVDEYLEVERDRIGARSDERWFKVWPIARQERLIQRIWNSVNGEGSMESRPWTSDDLDRAKKMREAGASTRAIATELGRSAGDVSRRLNAGLAPPRATGFDPRLSPDEGYAAKRALEGLTPTQIADEMELPAGQVRAALSNARRKAPDLNIPLGKKGRGMQSRAYRQGANVPYDLNPLMLFSQAERMARSFPEERSTRMHMMRWMEKRVRKAELSFMDFENEFAKAGKTGNPLVDRATKQELMDFIQSRKLRLTTKYAYGRPGGTVDYTKRFNRDGGVEFGPFDKAAEFAGFTQKTDEGGIADLAQYSDYTLLGSNAINHNFMEVGIVIEPGQPGSEFTGSHVGGLGAVAGMLVSDMPIEVDGKTLNAFAVHQGQSDYHDAKPEQYVDRQAQIKERDRIGRELVEEIIKAGQPAELNQFGFVVTDPGDGIFSNAVGVAGRDLPKDLRDRLAAHEKLDFNYMSKRDINAPYRYTHPELMFRTAFMMAVSGGHDALLWPTADTIRMYRGHSTYKGDFYDKRWPTYAKSWLGEFKPQIDKVEINYNGSMDEEFEEETPLGSFEDELDNWMGDEAKDLRGDLRAQFIGPPGSDVELEEFLDEVLEGLQDNLAERHGIWTSKLESGISIDSIRKEAVQRAKAMLSDYNEDAKLVGFSEMNLKSVFVQFASSYAERFKTVLQQARDATTPGGSGGRKKAKAEVYVMRITPEMRASFLETGAPMFNKGEAPIQADDVPIRPKKWVNEMERAIKAAAACAASAPATGAAASMAIGFGASLGISAPLALAIAGQAESDRLYQQAMGMTRELRRQAGLLPANDYVNDQGTFVAPEYDSEGFVEPVMPVDPTQYSNAELRAAEEEIRSLSPRAIVTDADIRRQADVRRNNLRFTPLSELNAEDQP